MNDHQDKVIWRRDLMERLGGVTTETVRRWLKDGKLPKPDVDLSRRTRGWRLSTLRDAGINLPGQAKLLRQHGLQPRDADRFELDHLVPLALGGHPRRIENLWMQPWAGEWSARRKDQFEVRPKNMVCTVAALAEAKRLTTMKVGDLLPPNA